MSFTGPMHVVSRLLVGLGSSIRPSIMPSGTPVPSMHKLSAHLHPSSRGFVTSTSLLAQYGDPHHTDFIISPPRNFGFLIVPEKTAYVIERFGRFYRTLGAGLHFLIPLVDRVAYVHMVKEMVIPISQQSAITRDNVTISIDGMLYVKVVDPFKAAYGVDNVLYAVGQLAQTTMRSELGKITLDKTFEEREALNAAIVRSINEAADEWGLTCLRYEIKDITPPDGIVQAMELQAEAERRKRAAILESEGERQAAINKAEGAKQQVILASEASRLDQVNRAEGEAHAVLRVSEATAAGLAAVAVSLALAHGQDAASLKIAEKYIEAFKGLAKETNTILLPAAAGDPAAMVASAAAIFRNITAQQHGGAAGKHQGEQGHASTHNSQAEEATEPIPTTGPKHSRPPVFSLRSDQA